MAYVILVVAITAALAGQGNAHRLSLKGLMNLRQKVDELRSHHVHTHSRMTSDEILSEVIKTNTKPELLVKSLYQLSSNEVISAVGNVTNGLLNRLVDSSCVEAATTELLICGMKEQLSYELSIHKQNNLYNVVYAWLTGNGHIPGSNPHGKNDNTTAEEITKTIITPIMIVMDELDHLLDVMHHESEFITMMRRELMGPNLGHLVFSEALMAAFQPYGLLEATSMRTCVGLNVTGELGKSIRNIKHYFSYTLPANFDTILMMNPPHMPAEDASKLFTYLSDEYDVAEVIGRLMLWSHTPLVDGTEVQMECARTFSELVFRQMWDNSEGFSTMDDSMNMGASSPMPMPPPPMTPTHSLWPPAGSMTPSHMSPGTDGATSAPLVPGYTDIYMLLSQHHSALVQAGISDISPIEFLTKFLQMLLDEAEANGINRMLLTKVIMAVVERIGTGGSQVFAQPDSMRAPENRNILKGILDQMDAITKDIRKLLEKPNFG